MGDILTDEQIKQAYLEWIERYTNNSFDINNLPGGIRLALDNLIKLDPLQFNVVSEKLSDMSQTFNNDGDIPKYIYNWIKPYVRLRSL